MSKKVIILGIAAVIVLVILGYWYYGQQKFSKSVLKLEILAPDSTSVGDEIEYAIKYKNNSNFTLESPKLSFEYPEHSISSDGKDRVNQDIQDIYPGDEQIVKFKARLFGKENDLKTATATVSYKPQNLNVRYESSTTFTIKINPVPINLNFDLPSKIEAGKDIQFSINYFSNIGYDLSDLKIRVQYPDRFSFISSSPKSLDHNEWDLPVLKKAGGGRISIKGKLDMEAGQTASFNCQLGIWQDGDFVVLKEASQNADIINPQVYISQQINGITDYVASPGENLHYEVYFKNIGSAPFENIYLIVKLDSSIYDLSTLKSDLGQVSNNMIVWDWKRAADLRKLAVNEEGRVEFYVNLKSEWPISSTQPNNTIAENEVTVGNTSRDFQTKVNSKLAVIQTGLYEDGGVFGNSGPVPPKTGQATTYTIKWQVKNFYNNVKNVKVKAVLPQNVNLTGRISPDDQSSKLTFDGASREVVWAVSDELQSGTGVINAMPTISFQVSITPSGSSYNGIWPLINNTRISGEDQWTSKIIEWQVGSLDTSLANNQNNSSQNSGSQSFGQDDEYQPGVVPQLDEAE